MKRITAFTLALAFPLFTAGSFAAIAEPAETAVKGWVESINALPGWSAKLVGITYDTTTDITTVDGLAIDYPANNLSIAFDPVSIAGYADQNDGTFDIASIATAGAAVTAPNINGSVKDIRLDGIGDVANDLDNLAWDPERPFTSLMQAYKRFIDNRLERGTIGKTSFVVSENDENVTLTHEGMTIDGWENGNLKSVTSGLFKMETKTPEGPLTITVAATEAHDIDYSAVLRLYDPEQYVGGVGDRIWRNAARAIGYSGIVFEGPDATIKLDSVRFEDIRVRQPERSFNEFFDRAMLDPQVGEEPTPEELRAIFGLLSSYSLGSMKVGDIGIKAEDGATGHVESIAMSDVSSERLGEFAVNDFEMQKPGEGSVNIGQFAFGGLVFPAMDAFIEAAEAEKTGADFDYSKLATQLAFFEANKIDVDTSDSPHFELDRARLDLGNYVGPIPTLLSVEVVGLDLPVSELELPPANAMWQALGYDRLSGDFSAKIAWNETDETVTVDDLRFSIADVGTISLDALLGGLTREILTNSGGYPESLIGLSFVRGTLELEDYPLLDRWVDQRATAEGTEPDALRQQIAVLLSGMAVGLGNERFSEQLKRVLEVSVMNSGSIKAIALPTAPIPLAALAVLGQSAPANLPDILGLTIESGAAGTQR